MNARPRLALTCGEPAGIGPDLCVMAAAAVASGRLPCDITCFADEALLRSRAAALGVALESGATPRCSYVDGDQRLWFDVLGSPRYGVLTLGGFEREDGEAQ